MEDTKPDVEPEKESKPIIIRNTTDLQRLKLEKLMKNPEKPIIIPEKPKERGVPVVPDFVRNVMGSSAGAGSGEFHVYRHLRRKEYARQKYMKEKGERERLDNEYHQKLEENRKKAAERTAKKRQKRLKRKQKQKGQNKKTKTTNQSQSECSEDSTSESESESESEKDTQSDQNNDSKTKQETEENMLQINQTSENAQKNKEEENNKLDIKDDNDKINQETVNQVDGNGNSYDLETDKACSKEVCEPEGTNAYCDKTDNLLQKAVNETGESCNNDSESVLQKTNNSNEVE